MKGCGAMKRYKSEAEQQAEWNMANEEMRRHNELQDNPLLAFSDRELRNELKRRKQENQPKQGFRLRNNKGW